MFPRDRRHLRSRLQTLRGDLRLLRGRTIATPSRPLNHLKPTDAARLRDVQLDVHFAVCNHTATSLVRGQLCTLLSCSARGDQRSAYDWLPCPHPGRQFSPAPAIGEGDASTFCYMCVAVT